MNRLQFWQTRFGIGLSVLLVTACGAPATPPKAVASISVAGTIEVSEPRVRLPASGQDQTAAYLTLTNTGTQADSLVRATSPDAKNLELHAHTKSAEGMMMMRQIEFIDVPGKATIPLVPGGLHIMVKQVKPGLKIGDTVTVELTFASGAKAAFALPVVANPRAETTGSEPKNQSHQH